MKHLWPTLLGATIRHVEKYPRDPDKLGLAVYYLACVANEYQRAGRYDISYQARALRARIETDKSLKPVWRELNANKANATASIPTSETPASNTGVKSPAQAELEEYLAYER